MSVIFTTGYTYPCLHTFGIVPSTTYSSDFLCNYTCIMYTMYMYKNCVTNLSQTVVINLIYHLYKVLYRQRLVSIIISFNIQGCSFKTLIAFLLSETQYKFYQTLPPPPPPRRNLHGIQHNTVTILLCMLIFVLYSPLSTCTLGIKISAHAYRIIIIIIIRPIT